MDSHAAEISRLRDERRSHEAQINIIDGQIKELEAESERQQMSADDREAILEKSLENFADLWKRGLISQPEKTIKNRVEGINQKLAGMVADLVSDQEYLEGLRIRGCALELQ